MVSAVNDGIQGGIPMVANLGMMIEQGFSDLSGWGTGGNGSWWREPCAGKMGK